MLEINIKANVLEKFLEQQCKRELKNELDFAPVAKCYMYLGNKDRTKIFYEKSIESLKLLIDKLKTIPNREFAIPSKILLIANCYKVLGNESKMLKYLNEALELYKAQYTGKIKEKPDTFKGFYIEFSSIYYFLGRYQEAYDIAKLVRRPLVVPPRGYALGILKQDKTIIEKTLEEVIEYIKDDRILPYYNSLNLDDPWEWYEIGRQLLGLPSVLDMFKEEKA